MATYELYLWEPEVDLSNQEWNTAIASHDEDGMTSITREKIYYLHKDKEHSAPHIEKFFNCILEILNKLEYQAYFEGLSDWIIEQQGYFNKSPRLVFQDEYTLANVTNNEFKRALYEAIEQSGVCAYETMNGYLLPSDSIVRKSIFKEIFNTYPVLVPQVPRPPVTLDAIPQNVTEMKDMLIAFMQQHPVGSQFEVEKIVKEFDDKKQYYGVYFKRYCESVIHQFNIMLKYINKNKEFKLEVMNNRFYIGEVYLSESDTACLSNNNLNISGVNIKDNIFYFDYVVSDLEFIYEFNEISEFRSLSDFRFSFNEMDFFNKFLFQLNNIFYLLGFLNNFKEVKDFFLNSSGDFLNETMNGFSNQFLFSLLKTVVFNNFSEEKIDNIKKNLVNSQPEFFRENIIKTIDEIIEMVRVIKVSCPENQWTDSCKSELRE
ncbi:MULTISPECIES: hypothetical protein [unclassified Acinetobacter]|uniref:hypothetical protein n=1 Tax=unclassified Acinetobacter TaxID=196816 RepID=UPI00244C3FB8|nr:MULTISPECIES: hypothetical protein [unclassified Acinetobacter]MDH0031132.1 hypothetical protein [Acinetobacter sp. GD04021]MDH0886718.1 hypothetical protein [Acinetobacter sp. GD03873]MDH1083149.1 hypothetical protein [Acinetobacter sp. GD03983]MDH2189338.1 hypothetical protein [Acinetobacter sp. GD03645]MDH2202855.1 hypothetical protein [Acinetobacter sp. GD03647]